MAAACLLAAVLTRPAAAAGLQPAAVTVTGDASSGLEYEETWTDGLTVKPWYFFGTPVLAVGTRGQNSARTSTSRSRRAETPHGPPGGEGAWGAQRVAGGVRDGRIARGRGRSRA